MGTSVSPWVLAGATEVTDDLFLAAAEKLSTITTEAGAYTRPLFCST